MPPAEWSEVLRGRDRLAVVRLGDRPPEHPRVLMPGSFNPVHRSHLRLARLAASRLRQVVHFELSIQNVEKPALDVEGVARRVEGLRMAVGSDPRLGDLWLTSAPRFIEKARLFPDVTFVLGLDTFRRLADPFYHGGTEGLSRALAELAEQRARFLVFFRQMGPREGWDDPDAYPAALAELTEFVPLSVYADEDRLASSVVRGAARP